MKKIFPFPLVFLTLSASFGQDYYPRNQNVDVQHYDFSISISDTSDIIYGSASINILLKGETDEIALDLVNQLEDGKGMQISALSLNGKESSFEHKENKIKINNAFKSGETVTVHVEYSGIPEDGLVIGRNKFGDRTFFGDNWPDRARNWLPSVDHPSDKASVDFIISAPEYYEVIANGLKKEESALGNGFKMTHWSEKANLSTKVMVFAAARFAIQYVKEYNGISVESWVYPQNRKEGFYDYGMATRPLILFDQLIGPYSYEKLANVQSTTRYGGMENASNIFYFENSVTGKGNIEYLLAHEIAHQWFGNSASEKDWHHIWLSEGFATYFAMLYMGWAHGNDEFNKRLTEARTKVINYYKTNPVPIVNTTIRDYKKLLNPNSYEKGGWVLHMLSEKIGEDNFMKGIRNYYRDFQNSNALTEDFKREMEKASGVDLGSFFKQWIYTAGQPELEVNWKYNKRKKCIDIEVSQKQNTEFHFPLEIGIQASGEQIIDEIAVTQRKQQFTLNVPSKPSSILLDPNVKLLFAGGVKN